MNSEIFLNLELGYFRLDYIHKTHNARNNVLAKALRSITNAL